MQETPMSVVQPDSPQALSRVLALMMVADTDLDPREVYALDDMSAFELLGIERRQFIDAARGFCAELRTRMGDRDYLRLSDLALIDELLDAVRNPQARLRVSCAAQRVITADGRVDPLERHVYDHMLARWGLTRNDVARALREPHRLH
jgi:uncharacterized tellurite resistance protein B-like protein